METREQGGVKILELGARIDSISSRDVEQSLNGLIAEGARQILCACHDTKYISSAGLRVLLSAAKELNRLGGRLAIACPRLSYAYEVLETAGFLTVIPVFDSVDEALRSWHKTDLR